MNYKKGDPVWFSIGNMVNRPGIIDSYCGEGNYWVINIETRIKHFVNLLDLKPR
jgi:hypothetical protein